MADNYWGNMSRAVLGQGLAMGWGDELEARIRTLAGDETYEEELNMINDSYTQFSDDNPGAALMGEIGGGFIPLAASLVAAPFTGGASTAGTAAAAARSAGALNKLRQLGTTAAKVMPKSTIGKGMVYGGGSGMVAGVGSGNPGDRFEGGVVGLLSGAILGAGIPLTARATGAAWRAFKERAIATESITDMGAIKRIFDAVTRVGGTVQDVVDQVAVDRRLNVPVTIGAASKPLANTTKGVRTASRGEADDIIELRMGQIQQGTKERVIKKITDETTDENYYLAEDVLQSRLRNNASDVYDKAYAFGVVDDPRINRLLGTKYFKQAYEEARDISDLDIEQLAAEGLDFSKINISEPGALPNVETLDYVKRGLDSMIKSAYKADGMSSAAAGKLNKLKKTFVDIIDEVTEVDGVSDYRNARKVYAGDAEVLSALELGLSDFSLPSFAPEQVAKLLNDFSEAEKETFAIGAVRSMLNKITAPATDGNSAKKIIGSIDMGKKLRMLFPNMGPSGYDLLEAGLKRERQLYEFNNVILSGSQTASNQSAASNLLQDTGMGEAAAGVIQASSGPTGFLAFLAGALARGKLPEKVQEKMAKMLMSESPDDVAAVVKALETYSKKAIPTAKKISRVEAATVVGSAQMPIRGLSGQDDTSNFTEEEVAESVRKRDAAR